MPTPSGARHDRRNASLFHSEDHRAETHADRRQVVARGIGVAVADAVDTIGQGLRPQPVSRPGAHQRGPPHCLTAASFQGQSSIIPASTWRHRRRGPASPRTRRGVKPAPGGSSKPDAWPCEPQRRDSTRRRPPCQQCRRPCHGPGWCARRAGPASR